MYIVFRSTKFKLLGSVGDFVVTLIILVLSIFDKAPKHNPASSVYPVLLPFKYDKS